MSAKISRNPKPRYQPELGVKQDFETLLQTFAEFGTVRYAKFAEVWRDMNMSYFCAGRQSQRECREFVEEVFDLAVPYWLPPSSFLVRAGALYLMYGLYNFQLVIPKVKFRVTADQWRTILDFQQEARDQQHLDLDYVFQKMVLEKAFCYVATPKEMYPTSKDQNESTYISDNLKEESSTVEDIFSSSALNQLSLVHDQYHKMKAALNSNDASMPDTSLSIAHKDWIQTLYKTLKTYKEKHTSTWVHSQDLEGDGSKEEKIQEEASVKKKLKEKAFETTTKGYRTRGSVKHGGQVSTEEEETEETDQDTSVEEKDIVVDKSQIRYHGRGRKKVSKIYDEVEGMDSSTKDVIAGLTENISMPDFTKLAARVKSANKAADLSEETKPEIGKKGPSKKKLSKTENTSDLFSGGNIDQEMEDTPSVKRKTRKTKESDKIIDEQSENENENIVANESKKKPKPNRKLPKEKSVTNDSASTQQFGTENELKTNTKSDTNNQQTKQPKSSGKKTKIKSEAVIVKEEPEEKEPDGPTAQERLQQKLRERQKQARSKKRSK